MALIDLNSAIIVVIVEALIRHVPHPALAVPADSASGFSTSAPGPDFQAGAVDDVAYGDVVDVQVPDNIEDARVLVERANGDAVRRVAHEPLDDDVCAVGLEGYAIVVGVDVAVLSHQAYD